MPSPSEQYVNDLIQLTREREAREAQTNVIQGLDGNKNEAVKSVDIGTRSGQDPEYIYSNFPIASKAYKSDLVQTLTADDPKITKYFRNEPLASIVSQDDVPNLVDFGRAWNGLKSWTAVPRLMYAAANLIKTSESSPDALEVAGRHLAHAAPGMGVGAAAGAGVAAMLGAGPPGWLGLLAIVGGGLLAGTAESYAQSWLTQKFWPEEAERLRAGEEEHPYAALTGELGSAGLFFRPGPMAMKALVQSVPIRALAGGVMGGLNLGSQAIFRDEIDPKDAVAAAIGGALFAGEPTKLGDIVTFGKFVSTHLKNAEYPPINVWRPWDQVVIRDTEGGMKQYDEVMRAAGKSETRDISPEMWEKYLDDKGSVGLTFKAVQGLYGDKTPTSGDGMLGDVPGITDQWMRSAITGEDIQVPWTHWTRVENEVEKQLHDFIRLNEHLNTLNENKLMEEQHKLPEAPTPEVPPSDNQQLLNDTRKSMGLQPLEGLLEPGAVMPGREQQAMLKAINKRNQEDIETEVRVQKRKAELELSEDWNREAAELHPAVSDEIEARPDFSAWRFFDRGELAGKQLGKLRLDPRFLTKEQLEKFPKHWLSAEGGNPDEWASMLGFKTGDELINDMIRFRELKGDRTYTQLKDQVVRAEIKRQMDLKYGDMDELTTRMARERTTGLADEDLVWSEIAELGKRLGQKPKYDREEVKLQAKELFRSGEYAKQSVIRYARELARTAATTSAAWRKGDVVGAFIGRQETAMKLALAREASAFEKRMKSDANVVLKPLRKVNPTNMDPEFADWAHYIMHRTGIPTARTEEHLAETIAKRGSYQTLEDFVNSHNVPIDPNDPAAVGLPVGYQDYGTTYNPNLPIWNELLRGINVPLDEMTVRQYEATMNSLRALRKVGQDKGRNVIDLEGKEISVIDSANKLAAVLDSFGEAVNPVSKDQSWIMKLRLWSRRMSVGLQHYSLFTDRVSRFDKTGIWNELVFNPGMRAEERWHEINDELKPMVREALQPPKGQDETWWQRTKENGVFYHPGYMVRLPDGTRAFPYKGEHELPVTNEFLVVLAAITRRIGGFEHVRRAFNLTENQLKDYMTRVMTKDHYDIADRLADPHVHVQGLQDEMTMRRNGTILEKDPVVKVWTPFGEMNSKYYPRIRDTIMDPYDPEIDPHPTKRNVATDAYWEEELTGAVYAQKMNLLDYVNDLMRRSRHVAISPYLDVYNKILKTDTVTNAMRKSFGQAWVDATREFFSDLAGMHGTPSGMDQAFNDFFRTGTHHAIVHGVGFNIGTIAKHSPQASLQTILEMPLRVPKAIGTIAGDYLVRAVRNLYKTNTVTSQRSLDFLVNGGDIAGRHWNGMQELKSRGRYYKDDLNTIADEALGRMTQLQQFEGAMRYGGTYTLSTIDSVFSKLIATARYNLEMDLAHEEIGKKALTGEQLNDAIWDAHIKAATLAARAVRDTHGSLAITSKPQLLRSQNPLIQAVSPLMNFFNNALNRRYRSMFMLKDVLFNTTPRSRWSDLRTIGKDMFTYFVLPTLIEDMVDPICKEEDSGGVCAAKFMAQGVAAPIPIVRDIVHAWLAGRDPSYGIGWNTGTMMLRAGKELGKLGDDDVNWGHLAAPFLSLLGLARGLPLAKPAMWMSYGYDVWKEEQEVPGLAEPEDLAKWIRIARWGTPVTTRHEEERERLGGRIMRMLE